MKESRNISTKDSIEKKLHALKKSQLYFLEDIPLYVYNSHKYIELISDYELIHFKRIEANKCLSLK